MEQEKHDITLFQSILQPTNFLVGILLQMMFRDYIMKLIFIHGGPLPVHVAFMLDEFDNVALPEDFLSLLSRP